MSVSMMVGVPSAITAAAVVAACATLDGPLAICVETHKSARRKLRWFFLHGCEERGVDATLSGLAGKLKKLVVAQSDDTSGFASIRTFSMRGRKLVLSSRFEDEGDIAAVLKDRFSGGDHEGYVTGTGIE